MISLRRFILQAGLLFAGLVSLSGNAFAQANLNGIQFTTSLQEGNLYECNTSDIFTSPQGKTVLAYLSLYGSKENQKEFVLVLNLTAEHDKNIPSIARLDTNRDFEKPYKTNTGRTFFADGTRVDNPLVVVYDNSAEEIKNSDDLGSVIIRLHFNSSDAPLLRRQNIQRIEISGKTVYPQQLLINTAKLTDRMFNELAKIGFHTVSDSSQKTSVTSGQASSQNSFQPYSVPQTLTLDNMLTKPMGCVSSRLLVDQVLSMTENIKRKFTVDEDDKSISVTCFENEICENMRYNGLKFDRFRIYHDGKGKVTRVLYGFMLRKTDGDIATYMNRIARDLQNLGIPLSYNPWSDGSSSDTVKKDGVEYNLSAMIYTSVWDICIEIRP